MLRTTTISRKTCSTGGHPRVRLEPNAQKLRVKLSNETTRTYDVAAHDPAAPIVNMRHIRRVRKDEVFNLPGMSDMSFVLASKDASANSCVAEWSMFELRPWLRDGRCMYGDRRGTFGHYFEQCSMVAAPLT